jgi:MoaA/NifB/PqqE/SkfB family radical SAM enzyme
MRAEIIQDFAPCNQDCIFCNAPETPPGLHTAQTQETIRALIADGVDKIIISGGEPTLRKDLFDIIRYFKEQGGREVELYTNAMRCDRIAYARELRAAGLDAAFVSLHHHDEAASDLLTRAPGTFRRTMRGIRNLNRCGVTITMNIVTNSFNYRELLPYTKFILKKLPFVRSISYSFVMSGRRARENPAIVPRMSEAAPFLMQAYAYCHARDISFNNPGCGVPLCFVPGWHEYSFEYQMLKGQSPSLRQSMKKNATEKQKVPACAECVLDEYCLGVWRGYLAIHGRDEIRPLHELPPSHSKEYAAHNRS